MQRILLFYQRIAFIIIEIEAMELLILVPYGCTRMSKILKPTNIIIAQNHQSQTLIFLKTPNFLQKTEQEIESQRGGAVKEKECLSCLDLVKHCSEMWDSNLARIVGKCEI